MSFLVGMFKVRYGIGFDIFLVSKIFILLKEPGKRKIFWIIYYVERRVYK